MLKKFIGMIKFADRQLILVEITVQEEILKRLGLLKSHPFILLNLINKQTSFYLKEPSINLLRAAPLAGVAGPLLMTSSGDVLPSLGLRGVVNGGGVRVATG